MLHASLPHCFRIFLHQLGDCLHAQLAHTVCVVQGKVRWAMAGRSQPKLESVRQGLRKVHPSADVCTPAMLVITQSGAPPQPKALEACPPSLHVHGAKLGPASWGVFPSAAQQHSRHRTSPT